MSNGNSHFHLHCSWNYPEMGIPSDVSNSGLNETRMSQPGYTVTLIAFDNTTLTSTLSRTAITVSCVDPLPTLTTI